MGLNAIVIPGVADVAGDLDLVRSIFASWEHGDFSSTAWTDPEIEYVIADGPSPGRRTGLTGMAKGSRTYLSAWENWHAEPDEYREVDGEHVLVLFQERGRGKTSGVELGQVRPKGASVFRIRGGKVIRLAFYFERERALADLGLAPQVSSPDS